MEKNTVLVLFGGCSTEYEVSLQSATAVLKAIDRNRYEVLKVGISREGEWYYYDGDIEEIEVNTWFLSEYCYPVVMSQSRRKQGIYIWKEGEVVFQKVNMVFPVLHGKNGEDGTVQGMCELAGIPVVGCGMLSSAIGMHKEIAHQLAADAGIRVPKSIVYKGSRDKNQELQKIKNSLTERVTKELGYPVFVKPMRAGSSFGITKVTEEPQLEKAVELALEHDHEIVIEEGIEGFEVGCAVLGNEVLTVGQVDEIALSKGFFDYEEKYTLKSSQIHMPARITPTLAQQVKETAVNIYRALQCRGFARVDMFLTPESEIIFNEVNTIPGFTSHSRYPNMLKGIGMEFEEVVNTLLALAVTDA